MRIAIDIRCQGITEKTGISEYTNSLLNIITKQNTTDEFCLFYNSFKQKIPPEYNNVSIVKSRIPNKLLNLLQIIFRYPHLDKLILKNNNFNPEIYFSPNFNFTTLSRRTKHILMIHDISFFLFPEYCPIKHRLLNHLANLKRQVKNATRIITPSEHTKNDLIAHLGVNPDKITVIYPGQPDFLHLPDNDYGNQFGNYILSVGTLESRKNIISAITAFEAAFSKLPKKYSLIITGPAGNESKIIAEKIKKSPIEPYLKHIGYVTPEQKKSLYQKAALLLYPSFYEGFGFPILEAMASGIPVITSNCSSLPEVGEDAVYYINPHHPEEITEGIIRILNQPTLFAELKQKGFEQAKKFSWEKTAEKWNNLINNL